MSEEKHSSAVYGANPMHRTYTPSAAERRPAAEPKAASEAIDYDQYFDAIMAPPDPDERYYMRIERSGTFSRHYKCYLERVESPRSVVKVSAFAGKLLFEAQKVKASMRANYHIWLVLNDERANGGKYFGKVRKVSDGIYSCFDDGLNPSKMSKSDNPTLARREFMALLYDQASEASEQDFRTITCIVPSPASIARRDELLELWAERALTADHVVINSRTPQLIDGSYHLDFEGPEERVQMASPMNFVLEDAKTRKNRLQVGKMAKGVYSCDFRAPISPFQAFALALGAFDVN